MSERAACADARGTGEARADIVFASGNAGKLRELDALLSPLGYRARPQGEFGIEAVEETATTFVENALLKARHACRVSALPAIADDSGLEVDALGGAPGLYSSRHAARHGRGEGDAANNAFLLEQLDGVEPARRTARFRSVVVLLRHRKTPRRSSPRASGKVTCWKPPRAAGASATTRCSKAATPARPPLDSPPS